MTHVLIIGAGLGGLALAQGLRRAGLGVAIYERDTSPADRLSGYRIHISPRGSAALHACLPPEVYQRFLDTTGEPSTGFSLFTDQLDELVTLDSREIGLDPADPIKSYKSVSRISLRAVLLSGLSDVVRFGKTFTRYEHTRDGRVTAAFDDGSTATGDLLVGADGVSSAVRGQYLPHLERIDTGAFAIAAKVPLTDGVAALLPEQFGIGAATIMAPDGFSGFAAVHRFRRDADGAAITMTEPAAAETGLLLDNTRDYVMLNVITTWDNLAGRLGLGRDDVTAMTGEPLCELVDRITERWHPNLRELVRRADADTISVFPFRSSPRLEPWPPSVVTLLGDAIHSMPPTAGAGANTALVDADLLRQTLLSAEPGVAGVVRAVGAYEERMRTQAQPYVDTAMTNLRRATSDSRFGLVAGKAVLRLTNRIGPLRRRMAAATIR